MWKGQGGVTHLGVERARRLQQLLHTPLEGRRVAAGGDAQRQGVSVQPGEAADNADVCGEQLAGCSLFVRLRVRLSPAVK